MSDEEPQQQSIQERIAALKLNQVGRAPITATAATSGKSILDHRSQSALPSTTFPSNGIGNEPRGPERGAFLPPPTITRTGQTAKPSPPPRLPARKDSTPSLPPRRPSGQIGGEVAASMPSSVPDPHANTIDVRRSSASKASSTNGTQPRILAPAYDPSTLPTLPLRHQNSTSTAHRDTGPRDGAESFARAPLRAIRSKMPELLNGSAAAPKKPALPQRAATYLNSGARRLPPMTPPTSSPRPAPPLVEKAKTTEDSNGTGKLNGFANKFAGRLSSRVSSEVSTQVNNEVAKNVPKGVPKGVSNGISNGINKGVSIGVTNGINNSINSGLAANGLGDKGIKIGGTNGVSGAVPLELDSRNFDQVVLGSSRPALISFSVPYCRYCVELVPIYEELAAAFGHASDKLIIAKVDVQADASFLARYNIQGYPTLKWFDGSGDVPEDYTYSRDLESMSKWIVERTDVQPRAGGLRDGISPALPSTSKPPPVPIGSRPNLSAIMATKPKSTGTLPPRSRSPASTTCLKCRDFSGPDSHAAKFPRQQVSSLDWLANQLTSPFSSLTDKARAIFTWLHHNIDYDTVAFFNDNVKPSTPASTLATGLAVCEGFASLFSLLATKSGMESIVISGHGKGYGFAPVPPGGALPTEAAGHAWNAVKLDDQNWKLIDPCWGAGNVRGKGQPYNREFSPTHFTCDNDEFGLRHFPTNRSHQFRLDGRTIEWPEYVLGDQRGPPVQVFSDVAPREGLNPNRFLPATKAISLNPAAHDSSTVRFQFEKVCPHWDPQSHAGLPFCYLLALGKGGASHGDYIPLETNTDQGGMFWWADVPIASLGAKGESITCYTVNTVGGVDGRGLGKNGYLAAKGKKGMGFSGVASWDLV